MRRAQKRETHVIELEKQLEALVVPLAQICDLQRILIDGFYELSSRILELNQRVARLDEGRALPEIAAIPPHRIN